jgi:hypothetical protein
MPSKSLFKRRAVVGGAVCVVLAGAGSAVAMASSSSNATYAACVSAAGAISKVSINTTPACGSKKTPISWNAQGPAGPASTTVVSNRGNSVADETVAAAVLSCSPGDVATGGGGYIAPDTSGIAGSAGVAISESEPHPLGSAAPTGWQVTVVNTSGSTQTFGLDVVCAPGSGSTTAQARRVAPAMHVRITHLKRGS